jgi:hypothetical protein
MVTQVGVGFSDIPNSEEAGVEAARTAMAHAGVSRCDLAILFSTSKHDPVQLRNGVRSVIGRTSRLVGGYSIGIITRDELGYDGYQVGVAVLSSDSVQVDMFLERGLPDNEFSVGMALGKQVGSKEYAETPALLLMYDSIKGKPPKGMAFNLNLATPLIEGVSESLAIWPPAAGVGMIGDWQSNPTYQWFDDRIEQQSAIALVLSGDIRLDTIIVHGCKPSGRYHTITKTEGNVVLEIDGKPAVDAIAQLLGPESYKSWEDYPFFVTLGVNKGDKFGEFREEDYANRLVMGIDKDRGGLIMFEPDLKPGAEVQLMRRSIDFAYIGERAKDLLDRVGDRHPFFALYIDCAGRASAYSGTEREEAEEVQKVIGSKMPLLGVYSGVEIARVGENMQALDWTGVLCVFSQRR